MHEELIATWRELEHRAVMREPRGTYSSGHRCWGCRGFVAGPTVTCPACGQQHGGVHHDAYATR